MVAAKKAAGKRLGLTLGLASESSPPFADSQPARRRPICRSLDMTDTAFMRRPPEPSGPSMTVHPPAAEVAHFTLKNGLEVVVIPDHRAPVVTHMVWYR